MVERGIPVVSITYLRASNIVIFFTSVLVEGIVPVALARVPVALARVPVVFHQVVGVTLPVVDATSFIPVLTRLPVVETAPVVSLGVSLPREPVISCPVPS